MRRSTLARTAPLVGSALAAGVATAIGLGAAPVTPLTSAPRPATDLPAGSYAPMPPNLQVAETDAGRWVLTVSVPLNRPNATGASLSMNVWDCVGLAFCHTTATPGVDVDVTAGTLVWPPGKQVATIVLRVRGDRLVEASETVDLRFDGPTGPWNLPAAWDNNAEILIANDD